MTPPFSTLLLFFLSFLFPFNFYWSLNQFEPSALTSSSTHSEVITRHPSFFTPHSHIHLMRSCYTNIMSGHIGEFITLFFSLHFFFVYHLFAKNGQHLNGGWSELSYCWLSCTWVWLGNEDKLGFSMDRDAGFFSKRQPDWPAACGEACASKRPRAFPVFSIRTLKTNKQPLWVVRIPVSVEFSWRERFSLCPMFHLPVGGHT